MKLKALFLTAILCGTVSTKSHCLEISGKAAFMITVTGLIFGKVIYDILYQPTDAQEIAIALAAAKQAAQALANIAQTHAPVLHILDSARDLDTASQKKVESLIATQYVDYPLYEYVNLLDQNIITLLDIEVQLHNKRIIISQRRDKQAVIPEDACKHEILRVDQIIQDHTMAITKLVSVQTKAQLLRADLQALKNKLMAHDNYGVEYRQACEQGRIKPKSIECHCSMPSNE